MRGVRGLVLFVAVVGVSVAVTGAATAGNELACPNITDVNAPEVVRFDRNGNAFVCPRLSFQLSLEKPLGTRTKQIRRGERFRIVIWSPELPEGRKLRYGLCVNRTTGERCDSPKSWYLEGGYEDLITWRVDPNEGRRGILTITLKIQGRRVASKILRLLG